MKDMVDTGMLMALMILLGSAVIAGAAVGYGVWGRDAKRYTWLRNRSWIDGGLCATYLPNVRLGADCPRTERLDTAIDLARKAPSGKPGAAGSKPAIGENEHGA